MCCFENNYTITPWETASQTINEQHLSYDFLFSITDDLNDTLNEVLSP